MSIRPPALRGRPAEPPFWALTEEEALALVAARADTAAPRAGRRSPPPLLRILGRQFASPITLILIVAALIATATGDGVGVARARGGHRAV